MPRFPEATVPFTPFPTPVPVPSALPFDAPLVCVQINETWMTYVLGCCQALLAASIWDTDDAGILHAVLADARLLIERLMDFEACPMITFRVNPSYIQNWQYSVDSGTTWFDGPDTASNFTPDFVASGGAPGGYTLSVNGDHTSTAIPELTAIDPNAVITDPVSTLRNLIVAGVGGAEGLAIQALSTIGVQLVQSNGIALALNKIPLFGLATSVLEALSGGTDYTFDLLAVLLP